MILRIDKYKNFSEWYNTITKEAELCDLRYGIKGFVVFRPWSVMTMNKMYSIYEKVVEGTGHVPALFPALIPRGYIMRESDHVEGFVPEVFWVNKAGTHDLEEEYAMRPTSETAMYSMYALWIHGHTDLPLKIYQRCQVWRHETKATKPFIRSREFHWIEAHDCFATEKDAMNQVREDMEMTGGAIHRQFGVPFLFFKRPQWDKFAGAVNTFAADTLMPDGRALQLPSTHMLGQNFSKAFGIKFTDESGLEDFVWQTCYGPAISRIYAAVIAAHGDERGLVLPFELAPLQIVIVPIYKDETREKVINKCKETEKKLSRKFSVKLDDSDNTPGFKFNHWEMRGVPIRIEIGPKDIEKGSVMLVRRDTLEKTGVKEKDAEKAVMGAAEKMLENLRSKADKFFNERMHAAENMKELREKMKKPGFVRVPFCSDELEAKECADVLKEKLQVNVRGSLFGSKETPKGKKCIACGKEARIYLYVAKQY